MSDYSDSIYDLLVIGGGVTGLTAANHAALLGLTVGCFEGSVYGGLVANVEAVAGYPAVQKTSGIDLAMALLQANMDLGVKIVFETVGDIRIEEELKLAVTDEGAHAARRIIIASGASLSRMGIPGEMEFEHRGVSQCASCDGPLFKEENVVVVGGGDAALQEALVLAGFCRKVTIIHRGERFGAKESYKKQVSEHDKIDVLWNHTVEEVLGAENVEKIRVRNLEEGRSKEIDCSGVFAFIGLTPTSEFLPPFIRKDEAGFIITGSSLETSSPGIFAAGAVREGYLGQLTNAVGEGTAAAILVMKSLV